MSFCKDATTFRPTQEVEETIDFILRKYSDRYKTRTDVLRAGVMRLKNWLESE